MTLQYKTFVIENLQEILAEGVVLPSGQVAIAWSGDDRTFVIYPDLASVQLIQDKIEGRNLRFAGLSPDGHYLTTFKLIRREDVTGISGNGIVAYGCVFHYGAVIEWNTAIKSIGYYPGGLNQIEKLHGHDGRTVIEQDYTPSW